MAISYLHNTSWTQISREERYFCAELFQHVKSDPNHFACELQRVTGLQFQATSGWEVGYEVCFYRDYLKFVGKSARVLKHSTKRTFDLCLFSENEIVILEAKVQQAFDLAQCDVFRGDVQAIRTVLERPEFPVHLVAIGGEQCFHAYRTYAQHTGLEGFGQVTWEQLSKLYRDEPLFKRAGDLYGC